jgi:hypothetical protein
MMNKPAKRGTVGTEAFFRWGNVDFKLECKPILSK